MDVVKDILSDSIPGLNITTCYSFDVFVAGTLVGKYVRKDNVRDEEGNILYILALQWVCIAISCGLVSL